MRNKLMMGDGGMSVGALEDGRYYTYWEVANILRCSERTVHNRVRNGEIKPLRNGRLVLFTQQCIEEFLQGNSNTPQTLN